MKRCDRELRTGHVPQLGTVLLSVAVLGLVPLMAAAQPGPGPKEKPGKTKGLVAQAPEWFHDGLVSAATWSGHFEGMEMLSAIVSGSMMGPGDGWFHPGRTKYGWIWMAYHFDKNHDGKITPAEFTGPAHVFKALDRNGDGLLTADDFDWSFRPPPPAKKPDPKPKGSPVDVLLDDLVQLLVPPKVSAPPKQNNSGMPSKEILLKGLAAGELGSPCEGPEIGDTAPDFKLKTHDGDQEISLAQFRGKKPVVLVFGSFT